MTSMSVSQARAGLPHLLDLVAAGEEITITRHGEAVAVVVRPDAFRSRRAGTALDAAARVNALLADARGSAGPVAGLSAERAEELVAEIRAGRADR